MKAVGGNPSVEAIRTMPELASEFLPLLEKSRLIPREQLERFLAGRELPEDLPAVKLASRLVKAGLLTTYQAERLLQGRARGFFVDHYKLLQILGVGGMGCVYMAEDLHTGERVALKILSERHRFDAGMLARLHLEADVRLQHPHIVQTRHIGHAEGAFDVYYIVMDFVEGISLLELINMHGPIPWQRACDMFCQAARALEHAHQAGLVHRDIKPENLLVERDGTVKLLDFGLSLLEQAHEDEFSLAMIFGHDCLGSSDYMPPEQWEDSFAVDARADVYSLGCTMYVALAAAFPFPAKSAQEKKALHQRGAARPLSEAAPSVPADVAAVVRKMMAPRPEDRFQSMREVAAALVPFAQRGPVEFDFEAVLQKRAVAAKKREAAESAARQRTSSTTQAAGSGVGGRRSAVQVDTSLAAHDTEPVLEFASGRQPLCRGGPEHAAQEPATLSPPVPDLAATAGPLWLQRLDGGPAVMVAGPQTLVGRNPDCDLRLESRGVSGRHCEFRAHGSFWQVVDLGSKNGVFVNGQRVASQLLTPGDRLSIAGEVHFLVTSGPDAPRGGHRRWWLWGSALLAVVLGTAALAGWWLS